MSEFSIPLSAAQQLRFHNSSRISLLTMMYHLWNNVNVLIKIS